MALHPDVTVDILLNGKVLATVTIQPDHMWDADMVNLLSMFDAQAMLGFRIGEDTVANGHALTDRLWEHPLPTV